MFGGSFVQSAAAIAGFGKCFSCIASVSAFIGIADNHAAARADRPARQVGKCDS